ncbi:DUF551 domain-containing protein [Escherichia coli]|nr:DUF551 domain-containing protein [Escherichia coli]
MSKIDYQALRAKAEKSTCGVWSLEYGEERFDAGDALIHREVVGYLPICRIEGAHPESGFDEDFQMEQQANAEFIAAANPATVLTLLNELETAKKRIMVMYEDGEMWSAMWNGNRWDDGTEYPDPHSVTHWREMPAAPQQEVK